MAEPDHIFVNPLPNLADGGYPAAFPFFYIKPAENENIIRKFFPEKNGPVTKVDPIGNSPVIIKKVMTLELFHLDNDDLIILYLINVISEQKSQNPCLHNILFYLIWLMEIPIDICLHAKISVFSILDWYRSYVNRQSFFF